jgi:hypothetical protein
MELKSIGGPALAIEPVARRYTDWAIPAVYNCIFSLSVCSDRRSAGQFVLE